MHRTSCIVLFAIGAAGSTTDDQSVVLRVLHPRGTISFPQKEPPEGRWLEVSVDIEAFEGPSADKLRKDTSSWLLCYSASRGSPPNSRVPQRTRAGDGGGGYTCVPLTSGQLPKLLLPEHAGIPGASEHWFLGTHLEHATSGIRMASTYVKWKLHISVGQNEGGSAKGSAPPIPSSRATGSHEGFTIRGAALFAELQVLSLDPITGRLPVPPGSRLWVEVGANSRNTLASTEARCSGNEDVFVVSFEPLMGQYCRLTAADNSDTMNLLGGSGGGGDSTATRNGVALPFAVGASDEPQNFHVSALDGCSGLLTPLSKKAVVWDDGDSAVAEDDSFWGRCLEVKETRRVPTMTLETLISKLLPPGIEIDFLKVDTQGTALQVVESAGPWLDRIQAVVVDALIDGSTPLYLGQNTCSETLLQAKMWGFYVDPDGNQTICAKAASNRGVLFGKDYQNDEVEINVFFARDPLRWRPFCNPNPGGQFALKEIEDLFVVGTPNQVRFCDGAVCHDAGAPGISCGEHRSCSYATLPVANHYATRSEASMCFCRGA